MVRITKQPGNATASRLSANFNGQNTILLFHCFAQILFHALDSAAYRRNYFDNDACHKLDQNKAVVNQAICHIVNSGFIILPEKGKCCDHVRNIAQQMGRHRAEHQVFLKEAGNTDNGECKNIIKEELYRVQEIHALQKL